MTRWCRWCQRFLGECAPYEVLSITDGLCAQCEQGLERRNADPERTQHIARFMTRFVRDSLFEALPDPQGWIAEGRDLGLRPVDLLLGVVQPTLCALGVETAAGRVSRGLEHKLSSLAKQLLDTFEGDDEIALEGAPGFLLVTVPGDMHELGARILALALSERGVSVDTLVQPHPEQVAETLERQRYAGVGWSLAMSEQFPAVEEGMRLARQLQPGLLTALGGWVTKDQSVDTRPFDFIGDPTSTVETTRSLARLIRERAAERSDHDAIASSWVWTLKNRLVGGHRADHPPRRPGGLNGDAT